MVRKCANPECGVPFRFFRDGKLFRFELCGPAALIEPEFERRIENFWLCGSCASQMTLVLEDGFLVGTQLLPHKLAPTTRAVEAPPLRGSQRLSGKAGVRWQP